MFQIKVRKFEYCREFDRKIQQKNVKKKNLYENLDSQKISQI